MTTTRIKNELKPKLHKRRLRYGGGGSGGSSGVGGSEKR